MEQRDTSDLPILPERRSRARAILRSLPAGTHDATLVCPLCGASVPARLRAPSVDQAWNRRAIPTALRDGVPLTILGSLMTLPSDTVTMDIDPDQGLVYVYWIEVRTTDQSEAQRMIAAGLEEKSAAG